MNTNFIRLAGAVLLGSLAVPAAEATTYGPPTPLAFPIHPFQASVFLSANTGVSVGLGTAAPLGVTSITLANQSGSNVQVDMFQATTSGAKCTGTITSVGGAPDTFVMVQAFQTLRLDYSVPLIVPRLNNQVCLAFDAVSGLTSGNTIGVLVVGYQN